MRRSKYDICDEKLHGDACLSHIVIFGNFCHNKVVKVAMLSYQHKKLIKINGIM